MHELANCCYNENLADTEGDLSNGKTNQKPQHIDCDSKQALVRKTRK